MRDLCDFRPARAGGGILVKVEFLRVEQKDVVSPAAVKYERPSCKGRLGPRLQQKGFDDSEQHVWPHSEGACHPAAVVVES